VAGLIKLGIQSYSKPKNQDIEGYKYFLSHPTPTGEGSSLLFIERFLPLIVLSGELAWAKKFIAEHFPPALDQLRNDMALHWWRLLMIYHLYAGDYQAGRNSMFKAFETNRGIIRSVTFDINLRCFDVFFFIMLSGPER